jgi:hypothetical protein
VCGNISLTVKILLRVIVAEFSAVIFKTNSDFGALKLRIKYWTEGGAVIGGEKNFRPVLSY